jgi:hypothetical protein
MPDSPKPSQADASAISTTPPKIDNEPDPAAPTDAQAPDNKALTSGPDTATQLANKDPDPITPVNPTQALPEVTTDGEEKHDWEVVNASPSHSPSKDGENTNTGPKGKGREREKSSNSTGAFGKDGKIGQKLDGVKKVLKSGVFGGSFLRIPWSQAQY